MIEKSPYQVSSDIVQNSVLKSDAKLPLKAGGVLVQKAPLDIYAKYVSLEADQRLLRWALQAEARYILPNHRVAKCLWVPHSVTIDILHDLEHQKSHYGGLCTCGSVWDCANCAAKISERRRDELACGISHYNEAQVGCIAIVTYTIRHTRFDDLKSLLSAFLGAHKKIREGNGYVWFREKYGLVGTIRCLEVTWGYDTGWHPHVHELMFFGNPTFDQEACRAYLWQKWQRKTELAGLSVNRKAFDFNLTRGAVADYIAKYGREPIKTPWGVEAEMTKAHIKQGRLSGRFTPFGLLLAIHMGHTELIPVFREYATYFKGKRQLQWSNGLKLMLGIAEKSDEEIASEMREEAILLGRLTREQWRVVLSNDVRGELLEVGHQGDWNLVVDYLVSIGVVF